MASSVTDSTLPLIRSFFSTIFTSLPRFSTKSTRLFSRSSALPIFPLTVNSRLRVPRYTLKCPSDPSVSQTLGYVTSSETSSRMAIISPSRARKRISQSI